MVTLCTKQKGVLQGGAKPRVCFDAKQPGAAREALLPMIPIERIVIDVLHMYLRISDRLLLVIRREIRESEAQKFVDILISKISCRGRIVARDGQVEFSNLVKADRKKIISFLINSDCLYKFLGDRGTQLKCLLSEFEKVMDIVCYSSEPETVRQATGQFKVAFLKLIQSHWVTPYLHILFHHSHELVDRLGSCLNVFTQQEVERLNFSVSSAFFSTTNFINGERQVLLQHARCLLPLETD